MQWSAVFWLGLRGLVVVFLKIHVALLEKGKSQKCNQHLQQKEERFVPVLRIQIDLVAEWILCLSSIPTPGKLLLF